MRCKKGDLAIAVSSEAGNVGKIVEVVDLLGLGRVRWRGFVWGVDDSPTWLVKIKGQPCRTTRGEYLTECPVPDAWLRPIRGDEDKHDAPAKEKELQS